jgi:hypothetical protein
MNENGEKVDIVFWLAVLAALAILFGLVFLTTACSHPGPPKIKIDKEYVPSPCVIQIEPLQPLVLPAYPVFPEGGSEEELKSWALATRKVIKEREALLESRIAGLELQMKEHNSLEPKCSPP